MTVADEAELELLQHGSAMRAYWWVTDVTEQFPWAKLHRLLWFVIIHLTFVISAVMMGVLDKMSFASHREGEH